MVTPQEANNGPISFEALFAERKRNNIHKIIRVQDGGFSVVYGERVALGSYEGRLDFQLGKFSAAENRPGRMIFRPGEKAFSYTGTEALYITPYGDHTGSQEPGTHFLPILVVSPSGDLLGQVLLRGQDPSTQHETTDAVTLANAAVRIYSGAKLLGKDRELGVNDQTPKKPDDVRRERARQADIMTTALGGLHARLQGRIA